MSFFRNGWKRLREALHRGGTGTLLSAWKTAYGELKPVSFSDVMTAYLRDPSCKAFVDFLADQTVGMGFYTTVKEDYEEAEEAKAVVDEFNESVNLDGLLQIGAREIVASGNSFWLKTNDAEPFGLKILPLTGFDDPKAVIRDAAGDVQGYKYKFNGVEKEFKPEQVIHWKWGGVNFSAYGTGVLQVLLQELSFNGEKRMSILEMKARIEARMIDVFEKYAGPDELWLFPGVSPDQLSKYQALIKSKPKAGARFVYDKADADIKTVQVDPRARYEAYIEHILNQVYLGGQTPLPKLFTTPGFTQASANAAIEIAERKVMALQRFIKRIVERDIFTPVLEQAGFDPKQAGCRLEWGMPEALDYEKLAKILPYLVELQLNAVIEPSEIRTVLREVCKLPLEEIERPAV